MKLERRRFKKKFYYSTRATRSEFVVKQFGNEMGKTILDVGSSDRDLEKMLLKYEIIYEKYTSVDINNNADYFINLDHEKLPFEKESFDTVVCTDVLEHLEKIHDVYNQLIEIAKKNIIISLPNPWFSTKKNLLFKDVTGKFYGLPVESPSDRHRWFFNFTEAETFLVNASQCRCKIYIYPYLGPSNKIPKLFIRLFLSQKKFLNFFCPVIWALIEK